MPIALIVIALDLLRFPDLLLPADTSRSLAFVLWIIGSTGIYLLGFIVLVRKFRHEGIQPGHPHFGWYIPPVSKLLIPVAGCELAIAFPAHADWITGLSLVSLGVGFFLFLFVGSAVFQRYLFAPLPPAKLAATFFVGIAPPAIIAVDLAKLLHLAGHASLLGLSTEVCGPLLRVLVVANWGLAAWWFVMSVVLLIYYRLNLGLPFAMSWWALTFPSGALAVASGLAWQLSGFMFIRGAYLVAVVFLALAWLVVFVRTVRGMISRKIFVPAH